MVPDLIGDGDIRITRAQNRNYAVGEGFRRMAAESNVWSLLLRYQAQAERQYRRAMEEFERLKALRPELPNEPNVGAEPEQPEDIAPLSELNPMLSDAPEPASNGGSEAAALQAPPPGSRRDRVASDAMNGSSRFHVAHVGSHSPPASRMRP